MKLLSIIGARPQFIKMAALHREIVKRNVQSVIVHTGQHYDENMSAIFFKELEIPEPGYNLNINHRSSRTTMGKMITAIEEVLEKEKPDKVIVFGDTNSTLAGALAAHKMKIPLVHIEAGLRSFNMKMPEEINRILTDTISDLLFCPTQKAFDNLTKEAFTSPANIILSGDLMFDSINYYSQKVKTEDKKRAAEFILCTFHRQHLVESREELTEVIKALNTINKETHVIMPAHPRTRNAIESAGVKPEFEIIDPVGYLEMLSLLNKCKLVITDSGGLQKEAYWCKKICITIREQTEWTELVDAGVNLIAGMEYGRILESFEKAKTLNGNYSGNYYGDGKSAEIILNKILG